MKIGFLVDMIEMSEYILLPREERRAHLILSDCCLERGGTSQEHRGVLAQFLITEFPAGKKIHLCHACNNEKCSNPRHLYWGTAYENNMIDPKENGTYKSAWQKNIDKNGLEYAKEQLRQAGLKGLAKAKDLNLLASGKGKVWITDGKTEIRVDFNSIMPDGFRRGRKIKGQKFNKRPCMPLVFETRES